MAKVKNTPVSSGETVTVACKLPNGLILRVFDIVEQDEPVMGGGYRKGQAAIPRSETYTLHGNRVPFGVLPRCPIVAGYALTDNIPKDFWDLWVAQNKGSALLTEHIVHAHVSLDHVEGVAEDHVDVRSGLEPLAVDGKGQMIDKRIPRKIATADEQPKMPGA